MRRLAWGTAGGLLGLCLVLGTALAGWEVFSETRETGREPDKELFHFQANRFRHQSGDRAEVLDFSRRMVIWSDAAEKKYTVMTFEEFRAMMRSMLAAVGQIAKSMPDSGERTRPKGKVEVTTIAGAIVAGLPCDGYRVSVGGKTVEEFWVTRKADFYGEIGPAARKEFDELSRQMAKMGVDEGYQGDPKYKKAATGGFPMRTVDKETGTVSEVTRADKKNLPASLFEEPKGYEKMTPDKFMGLDPGNGALDPAGGSGKTGGELAGEAAGRAGEAGRQMAGETANEAADAVKDGATEPVREKKDEALDSVREGAKEGIKNLFKW